MIEFRTQYLTEVVLTLETGESINSFLHLCPWNDEAGTMYLIEKAGIVSTTTQMEPRILSFTAGCTWRNEKDYCRKITNHSIRIQMNPVQSILHGIYYIIIRSTEIV